MKAIANKSKPNPTLLEAAGSGALTLNEAGIVFEQTICETYKAKRAQAADEKFERIPGLPYTHEERVASVRRAVADYRAGGKTFTMEELEKRMATW